MSNNKIDISKIGRKVAISEDNAIEIFTYDDEAEKFCLFMYNKFYGFVNKEIAIQILEKRNSSFVIDNIFNDITNKEALEKVIKGNKSFKCFVEKIASGKLSVLYKNLLKKALDESICDNKRDFKLFELSGINIGAYIIGHENDEFLKKRIVNDSSRIFIHGGLILFLLVGETELSFFNDDTYIVRDTTYICNMIDVFGEYFSDNEIRIYFPTIYIKILSSSFSSNRKIMRFRSILRMNGYDLNSSIIKGEFDLIKVEVDRYFKEIKSLKVKIANSNRAKNKLVHHPIV